MNESAIHISSVKREKIGVNKPHDFLVKFNPPLELDPEFKHFLALDRLSMTYSWYNIRSSYDNNSTKYTHDGSTEQTITLTDGMYSYSDINDYIHQYMDQKSHHSTDSKGEKEYSINLSFILSTYRVLVALNGNYQLEITKSIDSININTTAIKDSVVNGENTNTIAVIPTDNLTRSYPFNFEPRRQLYCPVSSNSISEMRIYVTDSVGQPIDLNSIDWFMTLLLRHTEENSSV